MRIYIHFGLIIDIHDDQSSFICIAFSCAHFAKLYEAHKQKKKKCTELIKHHRNLQTCAHTSTQTCRFSAWKKTSARKRWDESEQERERKRKRGFKRAFAHTVPTNGKRRYTINLLCYVENPYNASYWPYFTLVHLLCFFLISFVMNVRMSLSLGMCVCVWFCFCTFYSTILARMNATVRSNEWANGHSCMADTSTAAHHTRICMHMCVYEAQNIKWNAPARRRTQNSH